MPEKILVVDDVPVNVKLLADLLTVKGYDVVTAANGAEALAKVETDRPGIVLLDVMMPGMSGYDVCRKIRENPATTMLPIIMVTALDPSQERVKGIEAGADDFLTQAHQPARAPGPRQVAAPDQGAPRRARRLEPDPRAAGRASSWRSSTGSSGSSASSRPSSPS